MCPYRPLDLADRLSCSIKWGQRSKNMPELTGRQKTSLSIYHKLTRYINKTGQQIPIVDLDPTGI